MLREHLYIAGKALAAHKLRSLLTVLSIGIGAFSIVLTASLAQSGLTTLFRDIEELGGARLIIIAAKTVERGDRKRNSYAAGLTTHDYDVLREQLPHVDERSQFGTLSSRDLVTDGGQRRQVDLVAADAAFFSFMRLQLEGGRAFDAADDARHARVCVVAGALAQALWNGAAVGHTLELDGQRCRVVGQLADVDHWGMDFGFDWRNFVVLPLQTGEELNEQLHGSEMLSFKTDDVAHNDVVKRIANAILSERHHGLDDFLIFDMAGVMARFTSFFDILRTVVTLLAGIALVVGGVGVMNMMLVSVRERVREIGIRKALGASPRDIGQQFLIEAAGLAGSGGAMGASAGVLAAFAASALIRSFRPSWVAVVSTSSVGAALLVSLVVGLLFGWLPARNAGNLDPSIAMRDG